MLLIIVGIIFIIGGGYVSIRSIWERKVCTEIIEATIVGMETRTTHEDDRDGRGYTTQTRIYPIYEYEVNGEKYKKRSSHGGMRMMLGEKIQIHYNPNNPSEAVIPASYNYTIVASAIILVAAVIGAIIVGITLTHKIKNYYKEEQGL